MRIKTTKRSGGVTIECRVTPRAGRSRIKGVREGVIEVALAAPPVEGAANDELIRLLSKELGFPSSRIAILKGQRGRTKLVFVEGISVDDISL